MNILTTEPSVATIVVVHGAFEHAGRYDALAKKFQKDGFTVIYGDLPGQGRSEKIKGHIKNFNEYIQTVDRWIKEADLVKPIFLLGHSMGGLVVIRAMQELELDISGVILSSPAIGLLHRASQPLEVMSCIVNCFWPGLQVKSPLKPEMLTRNQKVIESNRHDELMLDKASIRWYREFRKAIHEAFERIDHFPNVPLLIMQAGNDVVVDRSKTNEWFTFVDCEDKTYKEWSGLYHEIFNEPEWVEVYQYTMQFISKHLKSK